jgi:Domain of unknown function (DUF4304)
MRASGFKGSGRTYRRIRGELIHVVNVQSSSHGGEFAVNFGVHLAFLPDVLGDVVVPSKLIEMSCELRGRMSEFGSDQWWPYANSQSSATKAVVEMIGVWERRGIAQLETLGVYPDSFTRLTPEDLDSGNYDFGGLGSTKGRLALIFGRIRVHEGRISEAKSFAKFGLSVAGERATHLKSELSKVANAR